MPRLCFAVLVSTFCLLAGCASHRPDEPVVYEPIFGFDFFIYPGYAYYSQGHAPFYYAVDRNVNVEATLLLVDGREVARVRAGTSITAYLTPGRHDFQLRELTVVGGGSLAGLQGSSGSSRSVGAVAEAGGVSAGGTSSAGRAGGLQFVSGRVITQSSTTILIDGANRFRVGASGTAEGPVVQMSRLGGVAGRGRDAGRHLQSAGGVDNGLGVSGVGGLGGRTGLPIHR